MRAAPWHLTGRRFAAWLAAGAFLLGASCVAGLWIGEEAVGVWDVLTGGGSVHERQVVWIARAPRIALLAGVGALLSLSGACFQGVLRNPLADPYVLGVAGGAALGTVLVQVLAPDAGLRWGRVLAAQAGAFGVLAVVLRLAGRAGRVSTHTLILAGVVINAFCSAGILLAVALLDPLRAHRAVLWMMGGAGSMPPWFDAAVAGAVLALALGLALPLGRTVNVLAAGAATAAHLGVDVGRSRWWVLGIGGLSAGAAVGEVGPIGFVGLVVPHAVRRVAGADHRLLFPLAALAGAALLVAADIPARVAVAPRRLPVGVFTAMLGAPFFLWILRRTESGLWTRT